MIYVTHDQVEAMTLADKIVVLDHGVISQVGAPMDLYRRPENKFVASFIGSPTMNFVPADLKQVDGSTAALDLKGGGQVDGHDPQGPGQEERRPRARHPARACRPRRGRRRNANLARHDPDHRASRQRDDHVCRHAGRADRGPGRRRHKGKAGENVGIIFDPSRCHVFASNGMVI